MLNIGSTIRNFKNFLGRKVLRLFVIAVILGVLMFGVESLFVFVLQSFLMQLGIMERGSGFGTEYLPTTATGATLLLIGFGVIRSTVWGLRYYFSGVTSQVFMRTQKEEILRVGLTTGHLGAAGEIVTIFNDYVAMAGSALQQAAMMVNTAVMVFLFTLICVYLAPLEFLFAATLLFLFMWPTRWIDQRIRSFSVGLDAERELVNRTLLNGLKNNFFLQIHNLVGIEVDRGSRSLRRFERHYQNYYAMNAFRNALPIFLGVVVIALTTSFSHLYVGTVGAKLLAFYYLFIRIAQGASDFYTVSGDIRIQATGLERLSDWSARAKRLPQPPPVIGSADQMKDIKIKVRDLSFGFEGRSLFTHLNLDLNPGERLVVKGESGSGKSTLLALMTGLLSPSSGKILINEREPRDSFASLSRSIGYVGPEPYLEDGTVRYNLLFGHPFPSVVTDEQLWAVLRETGLDAEVLRLKEGLDSPVPADQRFSTGQKQRLSLARAILRAPALLILDEATSNLDAETERKIVDLLSRWSHVTMLIVTHRSAFDSIASRTLSLSQETV